MRNRLSKPALATALVAMAGLELGSVPEASAQVYLRRNALGVLEATDSPESSEFRLRFSAKGVLIHSRGFRRRARPEFDLHHVKTRRTGLEIDDFGIAGIDHCRIRDRQRLLDAREMERELVDWAFSRLVEKTIGIDRTEVSFRVVRRGTIRRQRFDPSRDRPALEHL